MKLKTYRAPTMAQALALVKKNLGIHAVVLHTRTYKTGGLFGLWKKTVVEITASDEPVLGQRKPRSPRRAHRDLKSSVQSPPPEPTAGDLIRRTYVAAQAELAKQAQPPATPLPTPTPTTPSALHESTGPAAQHHPQAQPTLHTQRAHHRARRQPQPQPQPQPQNFPGHEQLTEELRTVRRMVGQMMRQQRRKNQLDPATHNQPDMPEKLFNQYLALLEQEVTEELADEIIQLVRDRLGPADLDDQDKVRAAVQDAVARLIPTDDAPQPTARARDGRPRTIALIGPTGVGKTTTIAKLCATFKLKKKNRVGLITLDTYRISAVDQLRTYANIIGVPLHVAATPTELVDALAKCAQCDVVLIDTAGRGQRDDPRLGQLKRLLETADPHEVHLVLSSTCAQPVLLDTIERFSAVRADRIIFTKLDEAVSFGVILNVVRKVNKRLSYITTGQEVPHQIEPGRPMRLAALVLGDKI